MGKESCEDKVEENVIVKEKSQGQFNNALQVYQRLFNRLADQLFLIFLQIISWKGSKL